MSKALESSIVEDDEYVVKSFLPMPVLPNVSLGQIFYDSLMLYYKESTRSEYIINAHTGSSATYTELLGKSCSLATKLQTDGYTKDAIFAIISPNSLEFFVPIFAAMYVGATVAPINHQYTAIEFKHCLDIARPVLVFCSKEVASIIVALQRSEIPYIEAVIVLDAYSSGQLPQKTESAYVEGEVPEGSEPLATYIGSNWVYTFEPVTLNAHTQTAVIMYSSGTTGLPKGVQLTHTNLMMRYYQTMDPTLCSLDVNTVILGLLPFYHAYGLMSILFSFTRGQLIVFLSRFEPEIFLRTVEFYRIPQLWLAPPIVLLLTKNPMVLDYDLTCVEDIVSGAAPLSDSIEKLIHTRFNTNKVVLRQGYGLTECTFGVIISKINRHKPGSCGLLVDFMQCKIRDPDTGRSLPYGQVGELCFKGPLVMKGYLGDAKATAQCFTSDGWLRSGDLGYYDDEGYFFIVDRLKELIKYKGFQVAPAELEGILLQHPQIQDVGVVGKLDEEAGELPVAFVVKEPGSALSETDVTDYVAGLVSAQKRLRGGVLFVKEIPKNSSGKILRRELRQWL